MWHHVYLRFCLTTAIPDIMCARPRGGYCVKSLYAEGLKCCRCAHARHIRMPFFYDFFVGKGVVCQASASVGLGRRLAGGRGDNPIIWWEVYLVCSLVWLCVVVSARVRLFWWGHLALKKIVWSKIVWSGSGNRARAHQIVRAKREKCLG